MNIKIPFINREIIKSKADQFRSKYWGGGAPVDIEKIVDNKLKMDIIPVSGFKDDFDIDAFITSDWSTIYVDLKSLTIDRFVNRLRFSLAHEVGHYVLHREIYESFKINSEAEYYKFYELLPPEEYSKLEVQAFIFAGYLLVPREILEKEKESVMKKVEDINKFDSATLQAYLAGYLAKKFGISFEAMQSILNFDNKK
jgi:hypothetical protein